MVFNLDQRPSWRDAQEGRRRLGQRLTTVNINSWTGAKTWLLGTEHPQVGVFVIQEHRLLADNIVDAKAQVRTAGWTAVFSEARPGRGARGPACGVVAIMAKSPFGLKEIR